MGDVSYKPLIDDMTWSYSRIKSFEDCKYRWYLKYIKFPKTEQLELFFSSYGTFAHELIASYYKGEKSAPELRLEYLSNYRSRVAQPAPSKAVADSYFQSGLQYFKVIQPSENRVVSVEDRFAASIDGIPFIGFIDRLDETPDGDYILIDNKSRTLKARSNRKKPTVMDKTLDEYLRQLYLYSVFVKERYGKYPRSLCFNCFRENSLIVEPFNEKALEEAKTWAKENIAKIADETEFRPDVDWFKCQYLCEMREFCPYYDLNYGKAG